MARNREHGEAHSMSVVKRCYLPPCYLSLVRAPPSPVSQSIITSLWLENENKMLGVRCVCVPSVSIFPRPYVAECRHGFVVRVRGHSDTCTLPSMKYCHLPNRHPSLLNLESYVRLPLTYAAEHEHHRVAMKSRTDGGVHAGSAFV